MREQCIISLIYFYGETMPNACFDGCIKNVCKPALSLLWPTEIRKQIHYNFKVAFSTDISIQRSPSCIKNTVVRILNVGALLFMIIPIINRIVHLIFKCCGINKIPASFYPARVTDVTIPELGNEPIRLIEVGERCTESTPCQHNCTITHSDGRTSTKRLLATDILKIIDKHPAHAKVEDREHFVKANLKFERARQRREEPAAAKEEEEPEEEDEAELVQAQQHPQDQNSPGHDLDSDEPCQNPH